MSHGLRSAPIAAGARLIAALTRGGAIPRSERRRGIGGHIFLGLFIDVRVVLA